LNKYSIIVSIKSVFDCRFN